MGNMSPVFTKRNKQNICEIQLKPSVTGLLLFALVLVLLVCWLAPPQTMGTLLGSGPVSWEGEVWSCYSRGTAGVGNILSCEGGTLLACDPTSVSKEAGEKAHVLSEGGQPQLGSKLFIQTLFRKKASAQKPTTPAAAHKSQSNEVKMNIACLLSAPRSLEV